MSIEDLESIALAMVAPGKGIIAIDESTNTIKKRFDAHDNSGYLGGVGRTR